MYYGFLYRQKCIRSIVRNIIVLFHMLCLMKRYKKGNYFQLVIFAYENTAQDGRRSFGCLDERPSIRFASTHRNSQQ